jgi:cation transport regulator ChaB
MPYGAKEIPKPAKNMPEGAQAIYRSAFNASYAKYGEAKAHAIAMSAVKRKYKKKGGDWVLKTNDELTVDSNIFFLEETLEIDDAAKVIVTKDGYLVGMPRVARTGIQLYSGYEMGMPEKAMVRVYRPETEVFNLDSWKTFAYRPVTLDHPPDMVDAGNWKKYAVGQCGGDVARDGDYIRVPMTIMDGTAISAVKKGTAQLSVGYTSRVFFEEGTAPDGSAYDAVQKDIRVNHIAVVDKARGGSKLTFGDDNHEHNTRSKPMHVLDVNGIHLELEDKDASIIQAYIKSLDTKVADAVNAAATVKTTLDAQVATMTADIAKLGDQLKAKDAEVTALKQKLEESKLTPQMIADAAREMADVISKAKVVLGDKLITEGKFAPDIKRQVVDAKLGDKAKGWDENQVNAAFLSFTLDAKPANESGQVYDLAREFSHGTSSMAVTDADKAYHEMCQNLENAYKGQQQKAN